MDKKLIIIVSVVVVILIIAFYLTYRSGKKNSMNPSNVVITDDIVGTTSLSDDDKQFLKGLSVNLYEDMDGLNFNRNDELYLQLSLLSDTELVALSNIYNTLYQVNTDESLYNWMNNEYYSMNSDFDTAVIVDVLLNRFRELGVS